MKREVLILLVIFGIIILIFNIHIIARAEQIGYFEAYKMSVCFLFESNIDCAFSMNINHIEINNSLYSFGCNYYDNGYTMTHYDVKYCLENNGEVTLYCETNCI